MAEPKSKATKASVQEFLNKVEPEEKMQDSFALLEMFEQITGEKAVMCGDSIVGFGQYHYKSEKQARRGLDVSRIFTQKAKLDVVYFAWEPRQPGARKTGIMADTPGRNYLENGFCGLVASIGW